MKLTGLRWPLDLAARLGLAALVPVVVIGLLVLIVPRVTGLPENAAVRVGETIVTEQELKERLDVLEALYGIRKPTEGPKVDQFRRDFARAIAVSMILDRAAQRRGIVISDKSARDALTRLIEAKFPTGGRDAFVTLLGDVGASLQDVLDEIKQQRRIDRIFEQVTKDIPKVTGSDARAAYEKNQERMIMPEQRRLRNIVVSNRVRAKEIAQRARSGADFAALANKYSLDGSTRKTGGDLGFVTRQQLTPVYAEAAFSTPPGSVFGPVQTRFGWNVGKVAAVRPEKPLTYQQVKKQLRGELRSKRKIEAWRDWLDTQIRQADVDYADNYRPQGTDASPRMVQ